MGGGLLNPIGGRVGKGVGIWGNTGTLKYKEGTGGQLGMGVKTGL